MLFICLIVVCFFYYLYGYNLIEDLYLGTAPETISSLVNAIYPRFEIEKHRHTLIFFQEKANQVFFRSFFVLLIVFLCNFYNQKKLILEKYFSGYTSLFNVNILKVLFYLSMIVYSADWYTYLIEYSEVSEFYQPILLFKILHIRYPDPIVIEILWLIYLMGILLVLSNIEPVISAIVVVILFIILQGFLYSFGKINHAYSTFGYVAMIMPFLLYDYKKAHTGTQKTQEAWSLRLIQLCIVLPYFFAGLEKLFISKFSWMTSKTLNSYLMFYSNTATFNILDYELLIRLLPYFVISFQVGFILVLFYKRSKYFFIPIGIIFHISIYLFMDIGALIHPWIVVYVFFIDWYKIKNLGNKLSTKFLKNKIIL